MTALEGPIAMSAGEAIGQVRLHKIVYHRFQLSMESLNANNCPYVVAVGHWVLPG